MPESEMRDRLPTRPHDLRELARLATGPSSNDDVARLVASLVCVEDDSLPGRIAALLADVSPGDVPRLAVSVDRAVLVVDHREAFVLACIDGTSTLEELIDVVGLPTGEVLAMVCGLTARGILVLERARRAA
jgi:hypothetical protein